MRCLRRIGGKPFPMQRLEQRVLAQEIAAALGEGPEVLRQRSPVRKIFRCEIIVQP